MILCGDSIVPQHPVHLDKMFLNGNVNQRPHGGDSHFALHKLKCGFLKMELRINKGKQLARGPCACHLWAAGAQIAAPADEFVPIEFTSEGDLFLLVGLTPSEL